MKKILCLCALFVNPLYASTVTVSTPVNYIISPALGMYCGTSQEMGPDLGACSTVDLGLINDATLPAYFSNATNGAYQDNVTFTTNSVGGGVNITGTGQNNGPNYFQLVATIGGTTHYIPYYVTYQSCTQSNPSQARRIDPSTGMITIPASESSIFSFSGSGAAPCSPTTSPTAGQGSGALYFYVNNGNEVTAPIPANATTTYQDVLTLTVNAT